VTFVEFLISLTFLYFFYFQGTYQQRQSNNLTTFHEELRRNDTNSTAGFGDSSDMHIIIDTDYEKYGGDAEERNSILHLQKK
jgi:preprotein translocase subunit YajC